MRHSCGAVEPEAGILDDFLDAVAGVHAFEPESLLAAIECEEAKRGHQCDRATRSIDIVGARSGCADEIHALDEGTARMLEPKQDHAGDHEIEIGRAERAGKPHVGLSILADTDEVDIRFAVDLPAG